MTIDRRQRVQRLLPQALALEARHRAAFLEEACAGDDELRGDVEALLAYHGVPLDPREAPAPSEERGRSALAAGAADGRADGSETVTIAPPADGRSQFGGGAVLGPYRIDTPLGAGGMGEVFRATDVRLNRTVAIKVIRTGVALDDRVRARFSREAKAIASLTHPHICTLYDVGREGDVDFLVMEYLEGETLAARLASGRLSLEEALTHAVEIAEALDHAHRHGIVHRDLKPANVMLTASGVKLLDFGVAKVGPAASAAAPATESAAGGAAASTAGPLPEPADGAQVPVTRGGVVVGTVRYMAPEQLQGREVDARTDLFSFGAVLFEMLTGMRAFEGDSTASIHTAILEQQPAPVSTLRPRVSPVLDDVVRRCLAKNPDERWQSARGVIRALEKVRDATVLARTQAGLRWRWVAGVFAAALAGSAVWLLMGPAPGSSPASSSAPIRSIAVLPLDNLSGDPEQEYFSDGMTHQLIANLAKVSALRVISSASVMRYRGARKPAPAVARELRVDAIVDGSVARTGDRVRIDARLISGRSGDVIWSQSFERGLRDVLTLHRDLARAVAAQTGVTLGPPDEARLTASRPIEPEVYRQVLLGRHHAARSTEEGLRKAVEYFDAAITRDPNDALAQAGLAQAYAGLNGFYMDPLEAMPKAKEAAQTAVRLDESLADGHAVLGYIRLVYDWDGPGAEQALLRALELNPTLAAARLSYAAYLSTQARYEEAAREVRRAVELDPLSIRTHTFGTLFMLFTRKYDEAIELASKGLEFEPNSAFTLAFQGVGYAQQGRFAEAEANMARATGLDNSMTIRALRAHVLALAGRRTEALNMVRQIEEEAKQRYFCPYEIGTVYVTLGDPDTASDWFQKGVKGRADCMGWLHVEPWLDPYRSAPAYVSLLRDIGLAPSAR